MFAKISQVGRSVKFTFEENKQIHNLLFILTLTIILLPTVLEIFGHSVSDFSNCPKLYLWFRVVKDRH